jgi:Protein of unknown function (DUF4235)
MSPSAEDLEDAALRTPSVEHGPADDSSGGTAAKLIGPLAAAGAAWGVRKMMDGAYRKKTGNEPPRAGDPEQSMRRILLWAAVTAAALAVVKVAVDRATSRYLA